MLLSNLSANTNGEQPNTRTKEKIQQELTKEDQSRGPCTGEEELQKRWLAPRRWRNGEKPVPYLSVHSSYNGRGRSALGGENSRDYLVFKNTLNNPLFQLINGKLIESVTT